MENNSISMVAIAKDEESFIEEWIAYHRLLGVDHFFIYDNGQSQLLKQQLSKYKDFVTVISFNKIRLFNPSVQVLAYRHAVKNYTHQYQWVSFLDIDEFIVFKDNESFQSFLARYSNASAIQLHSYLFGNAGCYEDPELVTSRLTLRHDKVGRFVKTIARSADIIPEQVFIHFARLKNGSRSTVLPNGVKVDIGVFQEKSLESENIAVIHHYRCRSFKSFVSRIKRGDAGQPIISAYCKRFFTSKSRMRFSEAALMKKFVKDYAFKFNKVSDTTLTVFGHRIRHFFKMYE